MQGIMLRLMKPAILLSLLLPAAGCYLLKQGTHLVSYNIRARSIERVLESDALGRDTAAMLRLVEEIRQYAARDLGLKENRNYTRFLSLDKEYLVDVVTACAKDSFTPYLWRFPFFGAFPYKGFYEREDALRQVRRLERKGLDVWMRQVDGFSTLGFFSDPIYSFMTGYSVFELADLIIHEQTHATIFIKNEVQFNEELATFVGRQGALAWIRGRFGEDSGAYRQALASLADQRLYSELVAELYEELESMYRLASGRSAVLRDKERIVAAFNRRLEAQAAELFLTERFRSFRGLPANNAYIMSVLRYSQDLELFQRLYEASGRDLEQMIWRVKQAEKADEPPKQYLRRLLGGG